MAVLLLAAIIAASVSTADSQLLVASSSFTADLYAQFKKDVSEKEAVMVGRIVVVVIAVIAYLIASSKGAGAQAIMNLVENAWGAFGASFGPVIILSLFWREFNYKGAIAGIITGEDAIEYSSEADIDKNGKVEVADFAAIHNSGRSKPLPYGGFSVTAQREHNAERKFT